MPFELHFRAPAGPLRASATVLLNPHFEHDGVPMITPQCATYAELDAELRLVEEWITRMRRQAKSKFADAGIPN
jgi:hypothetical protein